MRVTVAMLINGRKKTAEMSVCALNPVTKSAHATMAAYDRARGSMCPINDDGLRLVKTDKIKTVTVWDGRKIYTVL